MVKREIEVVFFRLFFWGFIVASNHNNPGKLAIYIDNYETSIKFTDGIH